MKDIYVTLYSLDSRDRCPENKSSNFKNFLNEPLILTSEYSVGIVEISMPSAVYSVLVDSKINVFDFLHPWAPGCPQNPIGKSTLYGESYFIIFPAGNYRSMTEVCDQLNNLMSKKVKRLQGVQIFEYNKAADRVNYHIKDTYANFRIIGNLLFINLSVFCS